MSTDRSAPQWGNKDARLAARLKYADELKVNVDIRKVNLEVGQPDLWRSLLTSLFHPLTKCASVLARDRFTGLSNTSELSLSVRQQSAGLPLCAFA